MKTPAAQRTSDDCFLYTICSVKPLAPNSRNHCVNIYMQEKDSMPCVSLALLGIRLKSLEKTTHMISNPRHRKRNAECWSSCTARKSSSDSLHASSPSSCSSHNVESIGSPVRPASNARLRNSRRSVLAQPPLPCQFIAPPWFSGRARR